MPPAHGMLKDTISMVPTNGRNHFFIAGGYFHSFRVMVNALVSAAWQQTGLHDRHWTMTLPTFFLICHGKLKLIENVSHDGFFKIYCCVDSLQIVLG
jgi:hypothetical protein